MDDLDEFLDNIPVTPQTDRHPALDTDEDFLAFLDTPTTFTRPAGDADTTGKFSLTTQSVDDGQDFLDWLQESSSTKNLSSTNLPAIAEDAMFAPNSSFIDTTPKVERSSSTGSTKEVSRDMDNFFNEVFGSPSPSTKSRKTLSIDESEADDVHMTYEEQVLSIVQSAFPDIQQLRRIVLAAGFVPASLRAEVWSLLLNETCAEDVEVMNYSSSDGVECENSDLLVSDVAALVTSLTSSPDQSDLNPGELRQDMHDILSLYCQRRQIPYTSVMCRLLSPLLAVPQRARRAQASSCFYNLASEFVPLINLNPAAYALSVNVTHSWLRLLLSYHSPALVQHLDRVVPHWEQPAAEMSTHQSVRTAATHKRNSELDELEKELGLDILDTVGNMGEKGGEAATGTGTLIESALPVREQSYHKRADSTNSSNNNIGIAGIASGRNNANTVTGLVPTHWITGIFTGSLPPVQAAQVLDYAVLTNCNFAGVYFSAALLHIYSASLLQMTGPRIRQWFDSVCMNNTDWYRNIAVSVPASVGAKGDVSAPENWDGFVNGWIHCTTALIRSTPQAFKDSLLRVTEWATFKAEYRNNAQVHAMMRPRHRKQKASSELDKISHGGPSVDGANLTNTGTSDTMSSNNTSAVNSDAEGEYSDNENIDGEEINPSDADSSMGFNTKSTFMSQFRRFSSLLTPEQVEKEALRAQRVSKLNSFPHEKLYQGGPNAPLCLTASVEEVIPCICSNKRRAIAPDDLLECFYTAATDAVTTNNTNTVASGSSNSNVFARFANVAEIENSKPFYFGIDCRSVQERALGQFPKAYAFDPVLLTDSDEIVKLLDMVETMAATAHLCLIGSGEGYLRWVHDQQSSNKHRKYQNNTTISSSNTSSGTGVTHRDSPELVRAFEEHYSKLNAVAMFFLKRSFKHVSILSGGFMAAVQYLHLPDSPLSLTAALVDSDRAALESLLGIVTTASGSSAGPTKRDSLVSYLPEPSSLLSVTSYFTKGSNNSSSANLDTNTNSDTNNKDTAGGSGSNKTASRSASPLPSRDNTNTTSANATTTTTASSTTTTTTTSTATTSAGIAATPATAETPSVLSSWGKKLTMFSSTSLETIKKGVASSVAAVSAVQQETSNNNAAATAAGLASVGASDEYQYEDDGMGPREFADTTSISISTTEREKQQALSLHRMAGLRKGDKVMINRTDLPGAILFPSIKYKEVWVDVEVPVAENTTTYATTRSAAAVSDAAVSDATGATVSAVGGDSSAEEVSSTLTTSEGESPDKPVQHATIDTSTAGISESATATNKVCQQSQVHRYLVVSRERFLVLDASGGGVGSEAVVKSNRHLTELMKMTFKKKDPELVTLFFVSPDIPTGKARQYRVSKRQEFVTALQKNMERFK